jgi:hypothetical protein
MRLFCQRAPAMLRSALFDFDLFAPAGMPTHRC